jgi:cation diffusion facilitator CzcD-associated flavoprotein CzcO
MMVFDWLVIGAGPSGIAVVGKLLDQGIEPGRIGWVDPEFKVGDLGAKWLNVPSNTKVALFHKFLNDCKSFEYRQSDSNFPLDKLNPEENCFLKEIAAPLQAVTERLKKQVIAETGVVLSLKCKEGIWLAKTEEKTLQAKRVVLANGSEPRVLQHPAHSVTPLEVALNPEKLAKVISKEDTVAVFGSSHSAVLILANLLKTDLKKLYNFYRSPHLYAIYFDDWILYDDNGLKGFAAK